MGSFAVSFRKCLLCEFVEHTVFHCRETDNARHAINSCCGDKVGGVNNISLGTFPALFPFSFPRFTSPIFPSLTGLHAISLSGGVTLFIVASLAAPENDVPAALPAPLHVGFGHTGRNAGQLYSSVLGDVALLVATVHFRVV